MVFESFTKKPFKDRLKDTGFLIKNSFTIIGKDKDIKTPTIYMIIFSTIMRLFMCLSLLLFLIGELIFVGVILILLTVFVLKPFSYFFYVRQKANQSWIVYNTACGKDISYTDSNNHTKEEKGKLRMIAFVDILMAHIKTKNGKRAGMLGFLVGLFLSFLEEVWDLLSHYMIPSIVIEQKSLKEVIPEIKALKTNVPAALVGVFGIDFVGSVIGSLFFWVYFAGIILSLGIGYLIALISEVAVIEFFGFAFSWIPLIITLFLIIIISGIYTKIVESIKVIYFTIFYTSIMRPNDIREDMRNELTHYLLMGESDFQKEPEISPHEKYINELSGYIKQFEQGGHSEDEVRNILKTKGYTDSDVNEAISKIKNN